MKVTREMICAAHDICLKKGDVILSAGLLEKIYLAMDALANHAKTYSSPVAWNGGKEGREWTTDKEVAEGWLIEHPMYQAMPLYAEPPEMSDLIKQRDELLVALENTHNALKRFWPEGHVDAIAALARARGDSK